MVLYPPHRPGLSIDEDGEHADVGLRKDDPVEQVVQAKSTSPSLRHRSLGENSHTERVELASKAL